MFFFATTNKGKVEEINTLLPQSGVSSKVENFETLSLSPFDIEEDGDTFVANADKKALFTAKELYRLTKQKERVVIADDSGLCVEALDDRPGIYSARYAENFQKAMQKILQELQESETQNRKAKFVCCLSFANKDGILTNFIGEVEGMIASEITGKNGFGYDPIFIPNGYDKTFGDIGSDIKNQLSHRKIAIQKAIESKILF